MEGPKALAFEPNVSILHRAQLHNTDRPRGRATASPIKTFSGKGKKKLSGP
jgi:hypothetical protein